MNQVFYFWNGQWRNEDCIVRGKDEESEWEDAEDQESGWGRQAKQVQRNFSTRQREENKRRCVAQQVDDFELFLFLKKLY
jgi:hypothetical protein